METLRDRHATLLAANHVLPTHIPLPRVLMQKANVTVALQGASQPKLDKVPSRLVLNLLLVDLEKQTVSLKTVKLERIKMNWARRLASLVKLGNMEMPQKPLLNLNV